MSHKTITIEAFVQGLLSGQRHFGPVTIEGSSIAPVATIFTVILVAGDNEIPVPSGASAVIIRTPVANTALVTLKGAGADTGIRLAKGGITVLNFQPSSAPSLILINSSANQAGHSQFFFI